MSSFQDLGRHLAGDIIILCHHNADPDAICASYAIKRMIQYINPTAYVEVITPDGASLLSEKVLSYTGLQISKDSFLRKTDTFVVVDTGSLKQLEKWAPRFISTTAFKIVIDHHTPDPEMQNQTGIYINDSEAIATCELVYWILKELSIPLDEKLATALLVGMSFDSRHFGIATPRFFRVAADLLEAGASLNNVRDLLTTTIDQSEKMARLKAAQRASIHKVDPWIIVTSSLGSFQSSAARAFIQLGADVAILVGKDKNILQASFRATEDFWQKTKIDLGEISKYLGDEFKGTGGGHTTAAGLNGEGEEEAFLIKAVEIIIKRLKDVQSQSSQT